MRAFVTGATGFIGQHLVRRLVERGDEVVALLRSPEKAARLPKSVETFRGDLSIFADRSTRLPRSDLVIHLAGVVAADRLEEYGLINHGAVEQLLECLRAQDWQPSRFLFASSLAAAGPSPDGRAWTEDDALNPTDPYGAAKAAAEVCVQQAAFPTTIFRPPIVFGPSDEATLTLFRSARSSVGMRLTGSPQRLSFVDVRDLVEAILLMADDRRSDSFTYYASHPQTFDVRELWRELGLAVGRDVRVLPVPRFGLYAAMRFSTLAAGLFGFKNQLDAKQYQQMAAPAFVCSSEKLRTDLGWQPRYDLRSALSHAAEAYRRAGVLAS